MTTPPDQERLEALFANAGFGLPPIKKEGMCSSYESPELSWDGLRREFNEYFKSSLLDISCFPWYLRIISKSIYKRVALAAWNEALFTNAKKQKELKCQNLQK